MKAPQTTTQIAEGLRQGGLKSDAKNYVSTISVALRTAAQKHLVKALAKQGADGRLMSASTVGGGPHHQVLWGLPSWKKALKVKRPLTRSTGRTG